MFSHVRASHSVCVTNRGEAKRNARRTDKVCDVSARERKEAPKILALFFLHFLSPFNCATVVLAMRNLCIEFSATPTLSRLQNITKRQFASIYGAPTAFCVAHYTKKSFFNERNETDVQRNRVTDNLTCALASE